MKWELVIEVPANGRYRKASAAVRVDGHIIFGDRLDMAVEKERRQFSKKVSDAVKEPEEEVSKKVDGEWYKAVEKHQQEETDAKNSTEGADAAAAREEVLDDLPAMLDRPLRIIDGRAYAAAWVPVRRTVSEFTDPATGAVVRCDPPRVEDTSRLVILREDGTLYSDEVNLPGRRPLSAVGCTVRLPHTLPPGKGWSGRGVKAFLHGERPDPDDVFGRIAATFNHLMDFDRSLAPQWTMCRLSACGVLASWLLDAFSVAPYVWTHGLSGSGKSRFLDLFADMGYLGQTVTLASSLAALRDLSDYGGVIAFDDMENLNAKTTDPDKRALLLAGSRRGVTIVIKELVGEKKWENRHVSTFSTRLFSATKFPDATLASRAVVMPLVRSGDPTRATRDHTNHAVWPHPWRELVDDLWAMSLAHLSRLRAYDEAAVEASGLVGRDAEPWRGILGVALWLQEEHGQVELFDEMRAVATEYQKERITLGVTDNTRLFVLALLRMWQEQMEQANGSQVEMAFTPGEAAGRMTAILLDSTDGRGKKPTPESVGQICTDLRLRRRKRHGKGRACIVNADEVRRLGTGHSVTADTVFTPEDPAEPDAEPGDGHEGQQDIPTIFGADD